MGVLVRVGVPVRVGVAPPGVCVASGLRVLVAMGARVGVRVDESVGSGVPLVLVVLTIKTSNSGKVFGGVTKPERTGRATVHPLVGIETMQGGNAGHTPVRG